MTAIGDGPEETDMLHLAVQAANNNALHQIIQAGYNAEHLWATIVVKELLDLQVIQRFVHVRIDA